MESSRNQVGLLLGIPLAVQWLGLCTFITEGKGSIPSQGTKVPQAARCSQEKTLGSCPEVHRHSGIQVSVVSAHSPAPPLSVLTDPGWEGWRPSSPRCPVHLHLHEQSLMRWTGLPPAPAIHGAPSPSPPLPLGEGGLPEVRQRQEAKVGGSSPIKGQAAQSRAAGRRAPSRVSQRWAKAGTASKHWGERRPCRVRG